MLGTLTALLARRPTKVAAIALTNKIARMAWAMMARSYSVRSRPLALSLGFDCMHPLNEVWERARVTPLFQHQTQAAE